MRYKKAEEVFPKEMLALIQQYVDGEYIYIPRRPGEKRAWGEKSKAKEELSERDESIFKEHQAGIHKVELAEKYFLSEKSIERIIQKEKNKKIAL